MDKKSTRRAGTVISRATEKMREFVLLPGATEEERGRMIRERLKFIACGIAAGAAGALFSRAALPFSVTLFGAALLCAVRGFTPFVYVGLCVSAVFSPAPLAYFLMYSMGILFRAGVGLARGSGRRAAFCEPIPMRILCGETMAFMIGLYRTVTGGFLYYDLFGFPLGMAAVAAAIPIFTVAFDKYSPASALRDACLAAVAAVAVWSLAGITVFGFSAATVAAFAVTLYVARECGALRAGAVGVMCGLAVSPSLAPMFALAGLAAGLFRRISTLAATAASIGIGLFYSVWSGGTVSLLNTAPDMLCATVIFLPLRHFGIIPELPIYGRTARPDAETAGIEIKKHSGEGIAGRFEAMQQAFGSLAGVFRRMSDKLSAPGSTEIRECCERVFDGYCADCARHSDCWDLNPTDTCDAIDAAARALRDNGRVLLSDVPGHTLRRCYRAERIVNDVNAAYSASVERALKENKIGVFASDYEAISRLIGEALKANAEEFKPDAALGRKLSANAALLDLPVRGIACYGTRRKTIVAGGVDMAHVRAGAEDVRHSFEKVCGFPLDIPEFAVDRSGVTMTVRSARRFRTSCSRAGRCRDGEEINGDSVAFFENGEDYFYALVSDGMGSGSEAALTSRLCSVFLDKMLRAGNSKQSALDMLNCLIRNKGIECFATVDLFELDLISGDACFVKSGAAPSYVVRGDSVFRVESGTRPVGIVKEAESEQISLSLRDGDVVVMLSDGVASGLDESMWLIDLLACDVKNGEPLSDLCEKIVDCARDRGNDDASCAIVKVSSETRK